MAAHKTLADPIFNPLWRRVALIIFLCFWTGVEIWNQTYGWAAFIAAITIYCGWNFFVLWEDVPSKE
ncbi:MAG: hypothetical protein ACPGDA_04915 [Paracoccaceae bacterium]|jgi:hypothetical protein